MMQWVWLRKEETRGERGAMLGSLPRRETPRHGHLSWAFSLAVRGERNQEAVPFPLPNPFYT